VSLASLISSGMRSDLASSTVRLVPPRNWPTSRAALEAVMNSIRNGLGMRETEIAREPS
jgi:hypothetical protein